MVSLRKIFMLDSDLFCLGTPATTSQMAKDVVTFLSWAAEPEHDERKKYGIKAVIIFSTLFVISLYVKRFKWGPIKNRKISMNFFHPLIKTAINIQLIQSITLPLIKPIRVVSTYFTVDERCYLIPRHFDTPYVKLYLRSLHASSDITFMANSSREQSLFGRRRSNTVQSTFRVTIPATVPLNLGDSKVLNAWVHDVKDSPAVIFNQSWWPGVAEGDLLKVLSSNADHPESAFLFMVPKDEGCLKPQLQVCFSFRI